MTRRNVGKQGWVFPCFSPDSDDRLSLNFHRFVILYKSCGTRSVGLGQNCLPKVSNGFKQEDKCRKLLYLIWFSLFLCSSSLFWAHTALYAWIHQCLFLHRLFAVLLNCCQSFVPSSRVVIPSTAENYNIDDLHSGDSTDEEDAPRKNIPSWAQGWLLFYMVVISILFFWENRNSCCKQLTNQMDRGYKCKK